MVTYYLILFNCWESFVRTLQRESASKLLIDVNRKVQRLSKANNKCNSYMENKVSNTHEASRVQPKRLRYRRKFSVVSPV